jgi:dTDP-glucose pyrophosphorylase
MRNEYEITDAIQIFLDDGYKVVASEVVVDDVNVSYPADLLDLNLKILSQQALPNWIAPRVNVHPGSLLDRTIVMDGAEIGENVALTECLVFPGTKVPAGRVRRRTIFTPDAEIRCSEGE